jgi:FAD/FMN-containing dehydrogenase
VRKHGLTIDHLLAAEIVTADGETVRADTETNPDLFWAIRGGGGNFGVVTRFQFRLQAVDEISGRMLLLPATPDAIASFVEAADAAPEELSAIANVMPAPLMPFVPEEHHGELVIMAMLVYAGPSEDGERAVEPFRSTASPNSSGGTTRPTWSASTRTSRLRAPARRREPTPRPRRSRRFLPPLHSERAPID